MCIAAAYHPVEVLPLNSGNKRRFRTRMFYPLHLPPHYCYEYSIELNQYSVTCTLVAISD